MKTLILVSMMIVSFTACSKEGDKKVETTKAAESSKATVLDPKNPAAPCDSKEDILKKLEEKKKAEAEKGKGFSLQGGNTGCSVK